MTDSTSTLKRWRVLCIAENIMVDVFSIEAPTICPNDHLDRSIDTSRTILAEVISKNTTIIEDNTPGNFQRQMLSISIPAGSPGDITNHDFVWPYNLLIWKTELTPTSSNVGDMLDVSVAPNTIVGALTALANIGDTVLNITSATFGLPNLTRGLVAHITNTITQQDLGRILAVDNTNFQITVENSLTQSYNPGTLFQITVCVIKEEVFVQPNIKLTVGEKGIRTKSLSENTVLRFTYHNTDGAAKNLYPIMEFNYY